MVGWHHHERLSVQSDVVYGHVGNAAARFALQRLGLEVWALPTVFVVVPRGLARVAGESVSADLLQRLVDGLATKWLGSAIAMRFCRAISDMPTMQRWCAMPSCA